MEANLTRLKMDKKFLKELKTKKEEAIKNENIVDLYDILDTYLVLDLDEEDIDLLYQKILEIAFDKLADILTKGKIFNFLKEEDKFIARAIYEHALERWDRADFKGANELFLILSYLIDDKKIQKGMFLALGATATKISLDDFIEKFVDKENLSEDSIFFDSLTKQADEFLQKNSDLINSELKKIEKLSQGR